jgi:hypothetical protein
MSIQRVQWLGDDSSGFIGMFGSMCYDIETTIPVTCRAASRFLRTASFI